VLGGDSENSEEKDDSAISTDHGKQVSQWLSGPDQPDVIIAIGAPDRIGDDTWKGNNFTGRRRSHRHLHSRVLETLEDKLCKPSILDSLCCPEQFKVLVPHEVVIRVGIVHSDLRKLIVDGFELAAERKDLGELTGNVGDQFFVLD
jgi:hypothetical protein